MIISAVLNQQAQRALKFFLKVRLKEFGNKSRNVHPEHQGAGNH